MNKEEILKEVGFDLDKAKQIHAWLTETPATAPAINSNVTDESTDIVTAFDHDGTMYVRVHVGKYDFCIDLHDAENEMPWDDAMKYAADKGMRLFTVEEGMLMYCFKDEINAKLVELGGSELREDDWYWSSTEGNRTLARTVYFYNGYAFSNNKYNGHVVRPVAAF